MRQGKLGDTPLAPLTRRRFIEGVTVAGVLAGIDSALPAYGIESPQDSPAILTGSRFHLEIDSEPVNVTGGAARATLVNGSLPGPTLRWRQGEVVNIAVSNHLRVPTSIHWHGIRVPSEMDGVPGLSFAGIAPGETFVYRIPVRQSGTYWYHSHSGAQPAAGGCVLHPDDVGLTYVSFY